MRITNKMITNRYSRDLNNSLSELNTLGQKVETGRKFQKGYEDPIGAVKAYRLRREYYKNESYSSNLEEIDSTITSAEGNLMNMNNNLELIYTKYLKGINGTISQDDREIITNEFKNIQSSIVSTLNSQFNSKYLFSGNSTNEPPFKVGDNNHLLYKGIDVTIADESSAAGTPEREAYDKLVSLSKENNYIDVGLSLSLDNKGELNKNSVFDIGIPGINILGYGKKDVTTEDGNTVKVNKNIFDTISSLCEELEKDDVNIDTINAHVSQYVDQKSAVLQEVTKIGSKSQYIDFLKLRTEDYEINLTSKLKSVELVDQTEAIMDWKMQEFSYTAALQMGMKIIQPSFLDFMR